MAEGGGRGKEEVCREEFLVEGKNKIITLICQGKSQSVSGEDKSAAEEVFVSETQRAATCDPPLLQVGQQSKKTCAGLDSLTDIHAPPPG